MCCAASGSLKWFLRSTQSSGGYLQLPSASLIGNIYSALSPAAGIPARRAPWRGSGATSSGQRLRACLSRTLNTRSSVEHRRSPLCGRFIRQSSPSYDFSAISDFVRPPGRCLRLFRDSVKPEVRLPVENLEFRTFNKIGRSKLADRSMRYRLELSDVDAW